MNNYNWALKNLEHFTTRISKLQKEYAVTDGWQGAVLKYGKEPYEVLPITWLYEVLWTPKQT